MPQPPRTGDRPAHIDRAWFRDRLSVLRLTQNNVARRIGLSPSALSRALSGARHFKAAEIGRMAAVLRVPEAEVLDRLVAKAPPSGNASRTAEPGAMEGQAAFTSRFAMEDKSDMYVIPPPGADPLFGCLAGSLTLLPDIDYAAPADPDWERVYDD